MAKHPNAIRIPGGFVPRTGANERHLPPFDLGRALEQILAQSATPAPPESLPQSRPPAALHPEQTEAVPFVDDNNDPVLAPDGTPMLRPKGFDPHFFVQQGLKDRPGLEAMDVLLAISTGNVVSTSRQIAERYRYLYEKLKRFGQWKEWDAQRVGGVFHDEFVNYATVAIGLYASALGLSRNEILAIENFMRCGKAIIN